VAVVPLKTARLIVRELTGDDAPFILTLLNDPSFIRNIGDRGVRTAADAVAYIENGPRASYARHGFGLCLVELNGQPGAATPIGICGLLKRDELPEPDIGFAFLPEYWSKGYAFEAASAVLADARGPRALTRLLAIVSPENESSIRLLDRLGFRYERMIQLTPEGKELKLFVC
jgi:RimJ/RimL family protein N-acetyltransferase